MTNDVYYIAIDGNDIGKIIEKYILIGELEQLKIFSENLNHCILRLQDFILQNGGEIIMAGGDNILAIISNCEITQFIRSIQNISSGLECNFSIGIGDSAMDSYLSLKYAKANRYKAVRYENSIFECISNGNLIPERNS